MYEVHIISREIPKGDHEWYYTHCGLTRYESQRDEAGNHKPLGLWFENSFGEFATHEPTCEACILMHWAHPENTAGRSTYRKLCKRIFERT